MNRLTRKASKQELIDSKYLFSYVDNSKNPNPAQNPIRLSNAYDKLGKLEDLEEELGCPLEVYTKLVYDTPVYDKNGYEGLVNAIKIYDYHGYGKRYVVEVIYFAKEEGAKNVIRAFPLEDYKKTWWLKEDKSE